MISVIIPTYNRAAFLARTIDSVLAQSYKDREIIVIDDGSTDDTQALLASYADSIRTMSIANSGVSHARNVGIKAAKGAWITLLDSDDVWHPTKLERQMAYHDSHPSVFISHTNERWMRHDKEVKQKALHQKPKGWCFEANLSFCKIAPSTVMIAKEVFEKVGYFDEELVVCEDYDLWLRILREYEIGLVEEILTTKYAGHEDQLSFSYPAMDTYRIKALLKHQELELVRKEITKKCEIISKGARKRGNIELAEYYESVAKQQESGQS